MLYLKPSLKNQSRQGFTLIELAIVIVIIGILAVVVAGKFGDLTRKAREGKVKASLGAIRSAITIYYSDTESYYPTGPAGANQTTLSDSLVPKYMREVNSIEVFPHHSIITTVDNIDNPTVVTDDGKWAYLSVATHNNWGLLLVQCTHDDVKGTAWSSY